MLVPHSRFGIAFPQGAEKTLGVGMNRYVVLGVAALAVTLLGAYHAESAWAAWPSPVAGGDVLLSYGAVHEGGTHRGVDVACAPGADVLAPGDGTVVFAGSVPADGGGTCGAITILTADGLRISFLPIDELAVSQHEQVRSGDRLGAVAPRGDASSEATHLHIGVRRGDAYLDPSAFFRFGAEPVGHLPAEATEAPVALSACTDSAWPAPSMVAVPSVAAPHVQQPVRQPSTFPSDGVVGQPVARVSNPPSRALVVDAGVPEPSTLRPDLTFQRDRIHVTPVAPGAQGFLSGVLLLAMAATAARIAALERAEARMR